MEIEGKDSALEMMVEFVVVGCDEEETGNVGNELEVGGVGECEGANDEPPVAPSSLVELMTLEDVPLLSSKEIQCLLSC